jgi:hypothetical protein
MRMSWFTVNREGLRTVVAGREFWQLVLELVGNGLDANSDNLKVDIERIPHSPRVRVTVDDGDSFNSMELAYTFFSDTDRRSDPLKRGRWTQGEKYALAIADEAVIESRNKRLRFDDKGRHESTLRQARTGSHVEMIARCDTDILDTTIKMLKRVHATRPDGHDVNYTVNGEAVPHVPYTAFKAKLESPINWGKR